MNLPKPSMQYSATDQAQARRAMEDADKQNIKRGEVLNKILMRDTATGEIRTITMTSGALVIT